MTEGKTTGGNQRLGYVRCYLLCNGNLFCETPTGQAGVVSPITIAPNTQLKPNKLIGYFGEVPGMSGQYPNTISIVAATSPVSKKVGLVWTSKRVTGDIQVNNDVFKTESDSNGIKWFPQYGGTWPPTLGAGLGKVQNISNYQPSDGERAYTDVAACYDYEDNLHVVWTGCKYDSVAGLVYVYANLYHWRQATGISLVAPGYWGGTSPGGWNRNISKMSISAKDPTYHGAGDSVFLFCTWTQFDSGDVSAGEYSNGDIHASASKDSGRTWTIDYNLTGTATPDCDSNNCLSEHWSSLAQNMYGGDLHIEYVCDKDPGGVIQTPAEGKWTLNPMMYMHVQQLPVENNCGATFLNPSPSSWTNPPIWVPPAGNRIISFTLKGIYNLPGTYRVTTDIPGATVSLNPGPALLSPGQTIPVEITISGAGLPFKMGYVYIKTCEGTVDEKTITLPVFAVCHNDYKQCMVSPDTKRTKDNCVCSLWVCSNSMEKWWLKSLPIDTSQILFSAGAFAAFMDGTTPIVGRQDYRDTKTGARDTIHTVKDSLWGEPQCKLEKVHVEKTYIWYVPVPPANPTYYWLTLNKQILLFHDKPPLTCPEWKKRLLIKYVWYTWGRFPAWWPGPPTYTGHPDIYYGMYADIDAPYDTGCRTMGGDAQSGCNEAGWDDANKIVWQSGYGGSIHPEYDNYYVGMALSNPAGGVVAPIGCKDVRNAEYLYPQSGWGWQDSQLYRLAATPINPATVVDNPDSVVDRSVVLTAGMIPAGGATDTTFVGEFILIEAISTTGLGDLQTQISNARTILMPELNAAGLFSKTFPICGDANGDGKVNASDVVWLINYLFVANSPAPTPWPTSRADVNNDTKVNASDVVWLINYLFVANSPGPDCSGFGD